MVFAFPRVVFRCPRAIFAFPPPRVVFLFFSLSCFSLVLFSPVSLRSLLQCRCVAAPRSDSPTPRRLPDSFRRLPDDDSQIPRLRLPDFFPSSRVAISFCVVVFSFLLVLFSCSMVVFRLLLVVFRFLLARVQCVPGQRRRRQHNHRASSSSLSPHSRFGHKQSVKHLGRTATGDAVLGDARTALFSFRGGSQETRSSECGEVVAVAAETTWRRTNNPQRRSVQRQEEEKSGCGEGGTASGASWQGWCCCLWRIWQEG